MLLRIVLMGLALATAALGVALCLSLTPSSAIVRAIPVWKTTEMHLPRASDDTPASTRPTDVSEKPPRAFSTRDIV